MHNSDVLVKRLEKKGWDKEEVEFVKLVLKDHQKHHHIFPPFVDDIIHIVMFGLMIILNGFAFTFLLPFVLIMPFWFTAIVVTMLGLGLGSVCAIIMSDLNHLEHHHHFFFFLIIPAATIVLFLGLMYIIQQNFFFLLFQNPLSVSFLYVLGFVMPFVYHKVKTN